MHALHLPRLGQTMDAGTITAWAVAIGVDFEAGETVYQVETEKVETEIEARTAGRLVRTLVEIDHEVEVGTPVAVVADPGETPTEEDIDRFVAGLQDTGTEPERDAEESSAPRTPPSDASRVRAVPKARRLASEHGLDLAGMAASGPGGRVTVDDVRAAVASGPTATPPEDVSTGRTLRGASARMAQHLARSWQEIPHFHEIMEVDVSGLARARAMTPGPERVTFNDHLVAAVAAAARAVPAVNATFEDGHLVVHDEVNVSLAVATDRGLLTPVLRGADQLGVEALSSLLRDLAERARAGRLAVDEMSGGTITLSNLGMYGVDTGAPVINRPQVALLFAGAVRERAVVVDGDVVARPTVMLTLACDHRVVDGATAAQYLVQVRHAMHAAGA